MIIVQRGKVLFKRRLPSSMNGNFGKKCMKIKKIFSLMTAFLCLFALVACGEKEVPPSPPPEDSFEQYREIPVDYTKIDATHEDSALNLWFSHAFSKTAKDDTRSTGRDTYKIYMGKNEKENCQFFLSAATEKSFFPARWSTAA